MRYFSVVALAGAMIAGAGSAYAGELPTYEVKSIPISPVQVQLLGANDIQEQTVMPSMTVAGMPASPAQIAVLSPRTRVFASAGAGEQMR